jgi:hypothetical protein
VARDGGRRRLEVVVRNDDGVRRGRARDAGTCGKPERGQPRAGGREQGIDVAVVAARELEHAVATGRSSRKPNCAHRGFRAGGDEAHLLDRGHGVHDLFREPDLALGRRAEARPGCCRLLHGGDHLLVRMAEEERSPRHHPVDVGASTHVLDIAAGSAANEQGLFQPDGPHCTDGRIHSAGDRRARPLPERTALHPRDDTSLGFRHAPCPRRAPHLHGRLAERS